MNAMANGRHEDSNNEQGSGNQEHNEKIGLGVHLNNYIDHSSIQGDVVGNAANEGVGSTTSFAGVAVAAVGLGIAVLVALSESVMRSCCLSIASSSFDLMPSIR